MNAYIYYIFIIVVVVIMFALFRYMYKKLYSNSYLLIDQPHYAKRLKEVRTNMKTTTCDEGITWTYNFWIYVNDWKYRFGEKKYIIQSDNINVWLGEKTPDLYIGTKLFNNDEQDKVIVFNDLPLQKWFNIAVILDNRNLDLFINKELYRSTFFEQVPNQRNVTNLSILPNGGLSGYISQFRYFSYDLSRSRIQFEYELGFRGIWYKFFILRQLYKLYMFFYNILFPDSTYEIYNQVATCK